MLLSKDIHCYARLEKIKAHRSQISFPGVSSKSTTFSIFFINHFIFLSFAMLLSSALTSSVAAGLAYILFFTIELYIIIIVNRSV